jgi:hypothetical protein
MSTLDRAFEHMREGARGLAGFGIDEIIDTRLSVVRHPVALDVKSVGVRSWALDGFTVSFRLLLYGVWRHPHFKRRERGCRQEFEDASFGFEI